MMRLPDNVLLSDVAVLFREPKDGERYGHLRARPRCLTPAEAEAAGPKCYADSPASDREGET